MLRKSAVAISETAYQPLKGQAGNWTPPTSSSIPETAGMAYHLSPRSANCGKVGWLIG